MIIRPRILRQSDAVRRMVQETWLTPDDFIVPLFIDEGDIVRVNTESGEYVERANK